MAELTLFKTQNYAVRLFKKTDMGIPDEQRSSYGVFHREHDVLFASTQSLGHAITAAQDLQTFLDEVVARENQPAAPAGKAN